MRRCMQVRVCCSQIEAVDVKNLRKGSMAHASVSMLSSRTATVQRPASLIHRSLGKNAVRACLPCGCSTHHHTCKKHAMTTAHAGRQGTASVSAIFIPLTPRPTIQARRCPAGPGLSSTGASVKGFAPSVRSARRVASVSIADLPFFPCQLPAETMNSCRPRLCTTARSPTWVWRSLLELQNSCLWHPRRVSASSLSCSMHANCACYGRAHINSAHGLTG